MKGSWYLRVHREEFPTTTSSTNVVFFFIAEHIVHVHSNLLSPFTLGNMDVILNARDDLMAHIILHVTQNSLCLMPFVTAGTCRAS